MVRHNPDRPIQALLAICSVVLALMMVVAVMGPDSATQAATTQEASTPGASDEPLAAN